jgi:predicted Zn-dependent peptidase
MGTLGSISRIGKRALEAYRRRVFTVDNLFLYLTGNVDDEMISTLTDKVGELPVYEGEKHVNAAPVPRYFGKRGGAVYLKRADFTSLRMTFDVDMSRVSVPVLDLVYLQLLGGYSSDFYIELSERRGLFYDLMGATERYNNIGTISFTYELREAKLSEALRMTIDILRKFKSCELPRAKFLRATYVDNAFSLYDDNSELNFTFAYDNHIMDLGYTDLASRRAAYEVITPRDILLAAREIFTLDNLTLTIKGNPKRIDEGGIKEIIAGL